MPEPHDVSREPPAHPPQLSGWVASLPTTGCHAQLLTFWSSPLRPWHPLCPGQVWVGRIPHPAGPALPTCQPSVLRLTCLLPDCQLSHWDLSGHLPPGSLLRKWEGVEEVLQRGGVGRGSRLARAGEGNPGGGAGGLQSPALQGRHCPASQRPRRKHEIARGKCAGGPTGHSQLCWGQGSRSPQSPLSPGGW